MRLKELRKNKKITQNEISSKLNIPIATYVRHENEETTPNIDTLIKLADFYGVSLDYLVDRNFNNEYGYISEDEKELLTNFKNLTDINKIKLLSELKGLLLSQK